MGSRPTAWTEARFNAWLGRVLRVGVSASAVVVLAGGALYLVRHGHARAEYGAFVGEPENLRTIGGILDGARHMSARGVIQFGLLILLATPVARVAFAAVGFARGRQWLYVAVAVVVLALLAFSVFRA